MKYFKFLNKELNLNNLVDEKQIHINNLILMLQSGSFN